MSSTSHRILELLEQGYSPSEIIKMGYPKSTVYYVYRKYRQSKPSSIRIVYVAHDTSRFERLMRLRELLESLGYIVKIGPWENVWDFKRILREVDIVLGIADARPSLRHGLFLREIEEANKLGKKVVIVAEKGATIRASPRTLIVTFSNDPRELRLGLRKLLEEFGDEDRKDFLAILGAIVIATIAAIGLVALFNLIVDLLSPKET